MPLSIAGRRNIPRMALCEAIFLEGELPLQAFATLTLAYHAAQIKLDDYFLRWTTCIQAHNRLTVGWIRATEHNPQRHVHAVLLAAAHLDCSHAETLWRDLVGQGYSRAAIVKPYTYGIGGLAYVMKSLGSSTEELQFSSNLSAFAPHSALRFFGRTSVERRHIRRIERQRGSP